MLHKDGCPNRLVWHWYLWSYCVIRFQFKVPEFKLYWIIFGYIGNFIFFFRPIIFLWNTGKASDFIPSHLYTCQIPNLPLQELPASQPSKNHTPFTELWIQDLADKKGGNVFQILPFLNTAVVLSQHNVHRTVYEPQASFHWNTKCPLNM